MGCDPKTFARFAENIRSHPGSADYWLDQWIDATTRATDWDACQWGFDPSRWMADERAEMDRLARGSA